MTCCSVMIDDSREFLYGPHMIALHSGRCWYIGPKRSGKLVAAAIERLCCKAMGTWEWVGYKSHVSEKLKCCVAAI